MVGFLVLGQSLVKWPTSLHTRYCHCSLHCFFECLFFHRNFLPGLYIVVCQLSCLLCSLWLLSLIQICNFLCRTLVNYSVSTSSQTSFIVVQTFIHLLCKSSDHTTNATCVRTPLSSRSVLLDERANKTYQSYALLLSAQMLSSRLRCHSCL